MLIGGAASVRTSLQCAYVACMRHRRLSLQVEIWNMRHRIGRLADACDSLAKHGPLKPSDKRGIDEVRPLALCAAVPARSQCSADAPPLSSAGSRAGWRHD